MSWFPDLLKPGIYMPADMPVTIGKYSIRGVLGRGGMGVVYKGYQSDLNRNVAIKVMNAAQPGTEGMTRRFLREARSIAAVVHPGIVQIYDFGVESGHHYIVMEFVEGHSLAEVLKAKRPDPKSGFRIVYYVAQALQAAHDHGIIHRDIKPSNILIDSKGQPKIVDFGVAKAREEHDGLTVTGDLLGTPRYMSPEQAFSSADEIDLRTDIYSLGVVLYEMLTGQPPFDGSTALSILRRMEADDPIPPSRLGTHLDKKWDKLVLRALEKDRTKRYQTAQEFAQVIRQELQGQGGGSVTVQSRAAGSSRKILRAVVPAVAVLLIVLGFVVFRTGSTEAHLSILNEAVQTIQEATGMTSKERDLLDRRRQKLDQASTALQKLVHERPDFGEAYYRLSVAHMGQGAVRKALEAAAQAMERGYDTPESRMHRVYALFVRHELVQGNVGIHFMRAHSTLGLEKDMEALRRTKATPEQLRTAQMILMSLQNQYRDVVEQTRGVKNQPLQLIRWNALFHLAQDATDDAPKRLYIKMALDELLPALDKDPTNHPAHFLGALFMMLQGNSEKGLQLASTILDVVSPTASDTYFSRAVILEHAGDVARLQENLATARQVDAEDPLVPLYQMAAEVVYKDKNEIRNTLADIADRLSKHLERIPAGRISSAAPQVLMGLARVMQDKKEEARKHFAEVHRRYGHRDWWGDPPWWENQASLAGLVDSAPKGGVPFEYEYTRALAQFNSSQGEQALTVLEQSLSQTDAAQKFTMDPGEINWYRILARLELAAWTVQRNDADAAFEHLRMAIQLGHDPKEIKTNTRFDAIKQDPRFKQVVGE